MDIHKLALAFPRYFVFATVLTLALWGNAGAQESTSTNEVLLDATLPPTEQRVEAPPYRIEGIPGEGGVVGDFVVGPGKVDLTLKPGESKIVQMTVTNRTGERRIFNLTTEDAAGSADINTPIVLLGSDRGPYSLKDYLSFSDAHFELGHNERAIVPVTIAVPSDAEPGGLYGSVLVDTVAIPSNEGDVTASEIGRAHV